MNRILFPALAGLVLLTGCVTSFNTTAKHRASSVVSFLYPKQNPYITPGIPTLKLPLRVGIAFVPDTESPRNHYARNQPILSEARKQELMKSVAADFKALPFVKGIEFIPTTYLRPEGGFENLDQLKSMFDLDVVVLLGFDQRQNSSSNEWSFTYWTIVGLYTVQAERNQTHTLIDATVYDIASRKLLFRAPGISAVRENSAPLFTEEQLRLDAESGYNQAAVDLSKNLKTELESFKTRIKEAPEEIKIEHRPGYTGGGSLEGGFALLLLGALGFVARRLSSQQRTS